MQLPVPQAVQTAYYYRFGDFANGYVNAFLVDGVVDLGLSYWRGRGSRSQETSGRLGLRLRAAFAALVSALSIVLYEVFVPGLARADWLDVPAGVLGALVYLGVRVAAITWRTRLGADAARP